MELAASGCLRAVNVDKRTLDALDVEFVGIIPGEPRLIGVKNGAVVQHYGTDDVSSLAQAPLRNPEGFSRSRF